MVLHGDPPPGCAVDESPSAGKGHAGLDTAVSGSQCSTYAADPATTHEAHFNADIGGVSREGEELSPNSSSFACAAVTDDILSDRDGGELHGDRSNTRGQLQQTSSCID